MRRFAALLLAVLAVACARRESGDTGRPASPEVVAGVYTSTVFIEPGANDAGVDVHARGGYVNLTLTADYKVLGKLVIPPDSGSNLDGTDQEFQGSWKPSGSGLVTEGTGTLIDEREWTCGAGTLSTVATGRGPLQISLQKMHDLPSR